MKKKILGQYFTTNSIWFKKHIADFILLSGKKIAYDPFAGGGDLLKLSKDIGFGEVIGLDIDNNLKRKINDSLISIPKVENSIIITNPPYLTNYSAKRKGLYPKVQKYFDCSKYGDLYKLALENCIKASDFVVAIIPETFINSSFPKQKLYSITILEENPFGDTENPVCVVCFDGRKKTLSEIKVYKNNEYFCDLGYLENLRLQPTKIVDMSFNNKAGKIAIRAVDMQIPTKKIAFMKTEHLNYDLKGIKSSSRLITIVQMGTEIKDVEKYIETCNENLNLFREKCGDILLSPFKGNNKIGKRRRRLDYKTARAILEQSLPKSTDEKGLFS